MYFERLFPMGVAALLEAADLVVQRPTPGVVQDETAASYEGWCRAPEARINWHNHVDIVYNLIRGCDPSPGAWTLLNGVKLQLFDVRKHPLRRFADGAGAIGTISSVGERSLFVNAQGGRIEVRKLRLGDAGKLPAGQFCANGHAGIGTPFGT